MDPASFMCQAVASGCWFIEAFICDLITIIKVLIHLAVASRSKCTEAFLIDRLAIIPVQIRQLLASRGYCREALKTAFVI